VVERRDATPGEAQRALPAPAAPNVEPQVEVEPAPVVVEGKRKAKRA